MLNRSVSAIISKLSRLLLALVVPLPAFGAGPQDRADASSSNRPTTETTFDLPTLGFDFAYDPASGLLAATHLDGNTVSILSLDADGAVKVKHVAQVGNHPTQVVAKQLADRTLFVIGCLSEASLYVIDSTKLGELNKIAVMDLGIIQLACSANPEDPLVYYCYGPYNQEKSGVVDLAAQRDLGPLLSHTHQVAVSASGRYLYQRHAFAGSHAYRVSRAAGTSIPDLKQIGSINKSYGFVCDPFEHRVYANERVFTRDLSLIKEDLPQRMQTFFPDRPWCAAVDRSKITVADVQTYKTVATYSFSRALRNQPSPRLPTQLKRRRLYYEPDLFADPLRDRFVYAFGKKVGIIPLASLKLPQRELLMVRTPDLVRVEVGKPIEIPLELIGPAAKLELISKPAGVELDGNRIKWLPTIDQVGIADLAIEISRGGQTNRQRLEFQVSRPVVPSNFPIRQVRLSEDSSYAAVWETKPYSLPNNIAPPMHHLGIVDLTTKRMVASTEMPTPVFYAEVHGDRVFVLPTDPTLSQAARQLLVLSRGDLSVQKRVPFRRPVQGLTIVGDKYISLESGNDVLELSLPDLQPVSQPARSVSPTPPPTSRIGNRWLWRGVVWNETWTKAELIVRPSGFITGPSRNLLRTRKLSRWGYSTRGTMVLDRADRPVPTLRNRMALIRPQVSQQDPVILSMHLPREGLANLSITAHDLVGFRMVGRAVVGPTTKEPASSVFFSSKPWDQVGSSIAVCHEGQLYVMSTTELDIADVAPPLTIVPKQSQLSLALDKPTILKYEVLGARENYAFTIDEPAGFSQVLDQPASVVIDGPALVSALLGSVDQPPGVHFSLDPHQLRINNQAPSPARNATELVNSYLTLITPVFEAVMRRKPQGVPYLLPVHVAVSDASGSVDRLTHCLFIELPADWVVAKFENRIPRGWKPGDPVVKPQPAVPATPVAEPASAAVSPPPTPSKSRGQLFADSIRNSVPRTALSGAELEAAADKALAKVNAEFGRRRMQLRRRQVRTWNDTDGNSIEATAQSVFAGNLRMVPVGQSDVMTVPLASLALSDADKQFLASLKSPTAPVPPRQDALEKITIVAQAIRHFEQATGYYPYPNFVSQQGQPLLSWRVPVLTYLGGVELARLFHFDEPWDSPHNRVLLAKIPDVFRLSATQVDDPTGDRTYHSSLVVPVGAGTVFPDQLGVRSSQMTSGPAATIVLLELNDDESIPWTKPQDLPAEALKSGIGRLRAHDGEILVGLGDGRFQVIPANLDSGSWFQKTQR